MGEENDLLHKEITDLIIKAFYKVYNILGYGFLEKVYRNAMFLELSNYGLRVQKEASVNVLYEGSLVGNYFADLVINDIVIIETKTATCIVEDHERQILNYLKGTDKEVGMLLNFGPRPSFKRKIFENNRKRLNYH
jgi:GxxExxY protein